MAAQQYVNFNGTQQFDVEWNGATVDDAHFNGVHVYTNTLRLTLNQHTTPINLAAWINARNPKNRKKVIVTNALVQPRLDTGNLGGMKVTLINTGKFQGVAAGDNGMNITSAMTLDNANGWIQGAGGNGARGGVGARGGIGATSAAKGVSYVTRVSWPDSGWMIWHQVQQSYHNSSYHGWQIIDNTTVDTLRDPAGGNHKCELPGNTGVNATYNFAGTTVETKFTIGSGRGNEIKISAGSAATGSGSHSIPGHAGGAGGAGGTGGAPGVGQWFRHNKTNGVAGGAGHAGVRGGRNSWRSPEPKTYYGNYGGIGKTGGRGKTGGNGGTWGQRGGLSGGQPGKAITGRSRLTAGSNTGHVSGAIT